MQVTPRSWLFVPGDSEKKLAKADYVGADALIVDLEDSVSVDNKAAARSITKRWLAQPRGRAERWVRVNPLTSDLLPLDVQALAQSDLDGFMLPKAEGAEDIARFAAALDEAGVASSVGIHAIVTETPLAVLRLASYGDGREERLRAMSWGAEDLASAVGATGNRHADGQFHDLFRVARALTLAAACACGAAPIDTLFADFKDEAGLERAARRARQEGFAGMLAIHPAQVGIINEAFRATAEERAYAQGIVDAFAAQPGAGTIGLDGKMIDRPHLLQAERLLAREASYSFESN